MALGDTAWAGLVRRGPSIVRRFRLGSGLVLFSYVFLHFLNHSLGNISWEAMERGAVVQEWIWRGPVGTVALYGAFAIHFSLAFWALYIRRHLRMGAIEALRLALGLLIPVLVLQHVLGLRFAYSYFDIHAIYRHALFLYWVADPQIAGAKQLAVFIIAWLHGCIGLHLWLRVKPHYRRVGAVAARRRRPVADHRAARRVSGSTSGRGKSPHRSGLAGGLAQDRGPR